MGFTRHRMRLTVGLLVSAMLATACAADNSPAAAPAPAVTGDTHGPTEPVATSDATEQPAPRSAGPAAGNPTEAQGPTDPPVTASGPQPQPAPSEPSPEPFDPYRSDVPVTATLAPTCTVPGGHFTIEVHTEPELLVAYHAIYAGEESGAPKTWGGEGHGGNNVGYANHNGYYVDSWVVSPDAPIGEGHVEVFAAQRTGREIGYVPVTFVIADPLAGGCP